jgi:hypothetical protein
LDSDEDGKIVTHNGTNTGLESTSTVNPTATAKPKLGTKRKVALIFCYRGTNYSGER